MVRDATALISLSDCATNDRKTTSYSPPLHNTTTVPVLEVNLLPVCKDEVQLIVHTNGPHKAFQMIEWLCFGDDNWIL